MTANRPPALVGEAPSRTGDPARPLAGRSGLVLCSLAGWDPGEDPAAFLAQKFYAVNLLDAWPGRAGKGTIWPRAVARARADTLRDALAGRLAVVLLGWRVALAFGIPGGSYGLWHDADHRVPSRWAVIPHPSGINQALNDGLTRRRAGAVLREAVDGRLSP